MKKPPKQTAIIRPVDFYEWQGQGREIVQQAKSQWDHHTFFLVTFHPTSATYSTVRFDASCLDGARSESDVVTYRAAAVNKDELLKARSAALSDMAERLAIE